MIFYFSGNQWQGTDRLLLEYNFIFQKHDDHSRLEPFGEKEGNIIKAAKELSAVGVAELSWADLCEEELDYV